MTGPDRSSSLPEHPLPQSVLRVPLVAGVAPALFGAEVVVFVFVLNLTHLRLLPIAFCGGLLLAVHVRLALATRRDPRFAAVLGRSLRYPAYCRPWPERDCPRRRAEPTFPRKVLD